MEERHTEAEQEHHIALEMCLERMNNGASIEECLARCPDYAERIRPMLLLAAQLRSLPGPEIRPESGSEALVAFSRTITTKPLKPTAQFNLFSLFRARATVFTFFLVFLFAGLFAAGIASADSLPGDFLYPAKLLTSRVRFWLAISSDKKAELRLTFSDERLEEVVKNFNRTGHLDTATVRVMLSEAQLALGDAGRVSKKGLPSFLESADFTLHRQKDALTRLKPYVDAGVADVLDEAISMCGMRKEHVRSMMMRCGAGMRMTPGSKPPDAMMDGRDRRMRCW